MTNLMRRGRPARLLIAAGLGTAAAGVWLLTCTGWGLIAAGTAAVLTGLTAIDVD